MGESMKYKKWPEGVEMLPDRVEQGGILRNQENILKFVFKRIERFLDPHSSGIKQLGDLTDDSGAFLDQAGSTDFILKVSEERNRLCNSQKIIWNYLDRRYIPAKYDTIEINNLSMNSQKIPKSRDYNVMLFSIGEGIKA